MEERWLCEYLDVEANEDIWPSYFATLVEMVSVHQQASLGGV